MNIFSLYTKQEKNKKVCGFYKTKFNENQNLLKANVWNCDHHYKPSLRTWEVPHKIWAVLTFIGYKLTDSQTSKVYIKEGKMTNLEQLQVLLEKLKDKGNLRIRTCTLEKLFFSNIFRKSESVRFGAASSLLKSISFLYINSLMK